MTALKKIGLIVLGTIAVPTTVFAYSWVDVATVQQDEYKVSASPDTSSLSVADHTVSGNILTNDTGSLFFSMNSTRGHYGSLSIDGEGAYTYTLYQNSSILQNLAETETLVEIFPYTNHGHNDYRAQSQLTIYISGNRGSDFVAQGESQSISTLSSEEVTGNLLTNDKGYSRVELVSSPVSSFGKLELNSEGDYTYRLFPSIIMKNGESEVDAFTYKLITDSGIFDTATLSINIIGNDGSNTADFQITNDFASIVLHSSQPAEGNVTSNDAGFKSAFLVSSAVSSYGSLEFKDSGDYSYTLHSHFRLETGKSVIDSFDYSIIDERGKILTGQLDISIIGRSPTDDPTRFSAVDDFNSIVLNSGEDATGNVTDNDAGVHSVTLSSPAASDYGALEFDSSGAYTYSLHSSYSLASGQSEIDTFTYTIVDSYGNSDQANLNISIIGKSDDDIPPNMFSANDDIYTIVKDVNNEVSGNTSDNDIGMISSLLVSDYIGTYGYITYNSDGNFSYNLDTQNQNVVLLNNQHALKEEFNYKIINEDGLEKQAKIIINILGNYGSILENIEVESNNTSNLATAIIPGESQRGHLDDMDDKDWFVYNSAGNEVLHIELCPETAGCYDEKSWVLYFFDANKLTAEAENSIYTFTLKGDTSNSVLGTYPNTQAGNHMYLKHSLGHYDDALIGIINPCFGDGNTLDIGVGSLPKKYLIAISSTLATGTVKNAPVNTCSDGSVVLLKSGPTRSYTINTPDGPETRTEETTLEYISAWPFSDDEYMFTITQTGKNALRSANVNDVTYSRSAGTLNIPSFRINDKLYSTELSVNSTIKRSSNSQSLMFSIDQLKEIGLLTTPDSILASYNPSTKILKIPKYVDEETEKMYTLLLYYHPQDIVENSYLELFHYYELQK